MVTGELLKTLRSLDRAEKLHVVQVLVSDLAREELSLFRADESYAIWSPYDAHEAAGAMMELLKTDAPAQEHARS